MERLTSVKGKLIYFQFSNRNINLVLFVSLNDINYNYIEGKSNTWYIKKNIANTLLIYN